jgi:very-long-chain (3R)-3-hydroxyacyl-CoA dehydratase
MLWTKIGLPLQVTQTLAVLEVLHSILRLVPSPVVSTFLQVTSRIVLVWGFTSVSLVARSHWSLYLMVGSWALVEVPRYAFYAINLITSKVPGPLFWLRYNLFAVS